MSWLYEYHNLIRDMNWLSLASTRVHTRCLVGLMLLIFLLFCVVFSFVCLYSTCVLCTLVFNMCFVYPMLPVSLDCLYSTCVLCTLCCQCLWIVCIQHVFCVPYVASVSGLFVFIMCFVYPMLPVSLDLLSILDCPLVYSNM